jgi:aquaporin Z
MHDLVESKNVRVKSLRVRKTASGEVPLDAVHSLRFHWPEYLMETCELGLYMFFACAFATLVQHPASPIQHYVSSAISRRALLGLLMGLTVVAIIMTPWGKQSGGHFNPAITLSFYRLRKVALWDAFFYVAAQFAGAVAGVWLAAYVLPQHEAVRYAVTTPGMWGSAAAFAGEVTISFVLMITILLTTNRRSLARYTPYFVGILYAVFITFETPLSGMSMNPARTFASALRAGYWQGLWIYFLAPTLGMLAAAEIYLWARGGVAPYCAKLHHLNNKRCIFRHGS